MKIYKLLALSLIIGLSSCGGGGSEDSSEQPADEAVASDLPAVLQKGMVEVSLNDYYVNAAILVPDETRGVQEISTNDFGETRVKVGTVYDVIFAELIEGDLNSKIQMLNEDITYTNDIIDQGEDFILYKSTITDSHIDPEFHFYAIKTIDGIAYEIHDYNEEGGYAESIARLMLESINHMNVNNSAS